MSKSKPHTEKEIRIKLKLAHDLKAQGKTVEEVCSVLEISRRTFYRWKKKYQAPTESKKAGDPTKTSKKTAKVTARTQTPVASKAMSSPVSKSASTSKSKPVAEASRPQAKPAPVQKSASVVKTEAALQQVQEQLKDATARIQSQESEHQGLIEQLELAKNQIVHLQKMRTQLAQVGQEKLAVEKNLQALQQQFKMATTKIQSQATEHKNLLQQLEDARKEAMSCEEVKAQTHKNELEKQEMQATLDKLQKTLSAVQGRIQQHVTDCSLLQNQLGQWSQALTSKEEASVPESTQVKAPEQGILPARPVKQAIPAVQVPTLEEPKATLEAPRVDKMPKPIPPIQGRMNDAEVTQARTIMASESSETSCPENTQSSLVQEYITEKTGENPAEKRAEIEKTLEDKHQGETHRFREVLEQHMVDGKGYGEKPARRPWIRSMFRSVGDMFNSNTLPIGIDMEDESLTLVQLNKGSDGLSLVQAKKVSGPMGLESESHEWGVWAVDTMRTVLKANQFKNRRVAVALPVRDTFIDHMVIPSTINTSIEEAIFKKMRKKLPYKATPENTIIKHIHSQDDHVVAIALERCKVERCLAMCVEASLKPELLSVWPVAMANSYSLLWTRKDNTFVMLLDVAMDYTNIVICRDTTLYYARSIPVGVRDLAIDDLFTLLSTQIEACCNQFQTIYGDNAISRTIFFAGQAADRTLIQRIAQKAGIPSQLGDPFGVLKMSHKCSRAMDQEMYRPGWSVAFGLSLTSTT